MHARDQLFPTSQAAPRFIVGDVVIVLNAFRLPYVEEALGQATVQRVTGDFPNQLYWLDGKFTTARTAHSLRLVVRP